MILLLKPAELALRGVNRVRRMLYRRAVLRAQRLPRPVISIGNRAMGGAGKTPTVIAVARHLAAANLRVVILSRGHGRKSDAAFETVTNSDARRYGDEPVLIARAVPEATVIVGADRYRAASSHLRQSDCDVFLLDDGFQHLQLHRDIDIVIEGGGTAWLREGTSALVDADLILGRGGVSAPFRARLEPAALRDATLRSLTDLQGAAVYAFAGLADNEQFFAMLEGLGARLVGRHPFPDHYHYSAADVREIQDRAKATGAALTVTTEKDAVKVPYGVFAALIVDMKIEPPVFFHRLLEVVTAAQNSRASR